MEHEIEVLYENLRKRFDHCMEMANKNKEKNEETFHLVWLGRADEINTILYTLEEIKPSSTDE